VHRFHASLIVALLVGAFLMLAAPARAGGPTSALLSVPGEGATASLYYTDPDYDALANLVGIGTSRGTDTGNTDKSGGGHETDPGVTVTWLIHDVTPWRVDRIYLEGEGAPWIATQVSTAEGMIWESPVVWHQPASPAELAALLDKLGVGEASRKAGDFNGVAGARLPDPAEPAPSTNDPEQADASSFAGIWWGLGGLAVGVLLTVLLMGRSQVAHADPATEPGKAHDEDPGIVVAEELSWPAPRA
jgi:hypothetical protein